MSSVDNRIVNMQFNNKQFVQGAADSQKALTGLDQTLAKTGQGTGLQTLGAGVDGIKSKFSAMQVAGVAALATIASKATAVGLNVLKSLTIDPIVQGFQEYQTNLNSIQTVVANTGKSVNLVNQYMQKLNTYSDQTIYNFSQMAHNIGTFTAAGVDLKTATASIQGIANLAALSGSSADQAATAMYQLSQAIAAGRVGLQDWNSVVNAGLGGKQFQTTLTATAQAMGTLGSNSVQLEGHMKKLTVDGNSFRQSISAAQGASSWLTSDVLVNSLAALDGRFSKVALGMNGITGAAADASIAQSRLTLEQKNGVKYSDKQFAALVKQADAAFDAATTIKTFPQLLNVVQESIGSIFSNSFGIILGDLNQSKELWGAVGDAIVGRSGIITKIGTKVTSLLRDFVNPSKGGVNGGRTKFINALAHTFKNLGRIITAVSDAWKDIFPPATGHGLTVIAKNFNQLSRFMVLNKSTLEDLKTIFMGFFSVLHIGVEILKGFGALFINIFKAIATNSGGASSGILSIVASVAEVVTKFDQWLTAGDRISKNMGKLGTVIGEFIAPFISGIGLIIKSFAALLSGEGINGVVREFQKASMGISPFANLIRDHIGQVHDILEVMSGPIDTVSKAFDNLRDSLTGVAKDGFDSQAIFAAIGTTVGTLAGGGLELAKGIISGVAKGIAGGAPEIISGIETLASTIVESFKAALGIHSPSTVMVDEAYHIPEGITQGLLKGAHIVYAAVAAIANGIKKVFTQLFGGMDAFDIASLINAVFSGGLILALNNLASTFGGEGSGFAASFASFFGQLGNTLKTFQNGIRAKALFDIAVAVGVLTGSLIALSFVDPKKIGIALGAIGAMVGILSGALLGLSKISNKGKGSLDLVGMSLAIDALASAVAILTGAIILLGKQDMKTLERGLGAIGAGLGLMLGTLLLFSKFGGPIKGAAASILVMSLAMDVLAGAIILLGSMDMKTLKKGLGAIAIGLGIMVVALIGFSKFAAGGSIEGAAASIYVMSKAMVVLAAAVFALGSMDMKTLKKGLGAIAVGLTILGVALYAIGEFAPTAALTAAAIYVMSKAMIALAAAVGIFGNMGTGTIEKGFIAIAAGLAIFLAAAYGAQFVAPGLAILGGVMLALGASMALAGAGMFLFATGFALLTATGVAGVAVLSVAFEAFISLLPTIAVQVAAAFVSFLETLAKALPRIQAAMEKIIGSMLDVVINLIPKFGQVIQALITEGLKILRVSIPQYIETGRTILDALIQAAAKEAPKIADAVLTMIQTFLDVIDSHLPEIIDTGTAIIVHLIKGLSNSYSKIVKASGDAILDMLHALDDAVVKYIPQIRDIGAQIAYHILDGLSGGLISKGGSVLQHAWDAIPKPNLGALGGLLGKRGAGGNPFSTAQTAVNSAVALVTTDLSQGDPAVAAAQKRSLQASNAAATLQAKAEAADQVAKAKEKIANAKKATKAQKDAATAARKHADALANQAQNASSKADQASQDLQDAISFRDADTSGKADMLAADAQDFAQQASDMLAKANAEAAAAKAKGVKPADRKKLEQAAMNDAKAASRLAQQAKDAEASANGLYAQEVADRLKTLQDDADQEAEAAALAAADPETKAQILNAKAAKEQATADAAKAAATALVEQAKAAAAAGNPQLALSILDDAEKQAQIAKDAADAAEQDRQAAEEALGQPTAGTGGGAGTTMQPSRSILEDAAKVADRYSQSLAQATALAAENAQPVQYVQNNYSPTALDAPTIYRNSKNLINATNLE